MKRLMGSDRLPSHVWSAALSHTLTEPVAAVVTGVTGSGKTPVSVFLAAALRCLFQKGDDLHPAAKVETMAGGTPLTCMDRLPWLQKTAQDIDS
jgi:gluconokinase